MIEVKQDKREQKVVFFYLNLYKETLNNIYN